MSRIFFQKHTGVVKKSVFLQMVNLFKLEVDLIFFNTMTINFAIDEEEQ